MTLRYRLLQGRSAQECWDRRPREQEQQDRPRRQTTPEPPETRRGTIREQAVPRSFASRRRDAAGLVIASQPVAAVQIRFSFKKLTAHWWWHAQMVRKDGDGREKLGQGR